jgi:hypothetical protein
MPALTNRSERESMSPAEKAWQDRRILRRIKEGASITKLRGMGISETRANEVAKQHGLTIAKAVPGTRRW